jgi:hypothetical protein
MMQATEGEVTSSSRSRLDPAVLCVGAFALLALIAYVPQWLPFIHGLRSEGLTPVITNRDFANYWMGGQLMMQGEHRILFTHNWYFAYFQQVFGADSEIRAWSYPPHFLLFLWPLGQLDYKSALIVFTIATFALFLFAVRVFRRNLAPESNPATLLLAIAGFFLLMVVAAQNGFLLAALLLFGLAWMKTRPVLAGLAFACLTVKPQLGLLIPVLLLFDRNWKVIGWSALFTTALVLLSIAMLGMDSWRAYLTDTLAYQRFVMTNWYGIFLTMMPTVFGSLRTLGLSPAVALNVQLAVSAAAFALVLWLLSRETDPLRRIFVIVCGTFLVTPYAFNYDMGALCVVAAVLAGSNRVPATMAGSMVIASVAGIAVAVMNLGRAHLPIAPFILLAGLLVIASDARRARAANVPSGRPLSEPA